MGLIQEKMQITAPPPKQPRHEWVATADVHRAKPRDAFSATDAGVRDLTNALPPGDNIEDQARADVRNLPQVMAGETDVSGDWNPEAVTNGFRRHDYAPTADAYTGEHSDLFYGEVTVDGGTGFVERGNCCDRI